MSSLIFHPQRQPHNTSHSHFILFIFGWAYVSTQRSEPFAKHTIKCTQTSVSQYRFRCEASGKRSSGCKDSLFRCFRFTDFPSRKAGNGLIFARRAHNSVSQIIVIDFAREPSYFFSLSLFPFFRRFLHEPNHIVCPGPATQY